MSVPLDIANAGFDRPYNEQGGISQLKVSSGWSVRWVEGPDSGRGFLVRPECYPKQLLGSDVCQGIQSTDATHRAAFVQCVLLPEGALSLALDARVSYYAPKGGMAVRVGLDSTGQVGNMDAESIHWGRWLNQDGDPPWPMSTWTTAKASLEKLGTGYVSIWLQSVNRWRGRDNHVFWRDVAGTVSTTEPDTEPDPGSALALIMNAVDLLLEAASLL